MSYQSLPRACIKDTHHTQTPEAESHHDGLERREREILLPHGSDGSSDVDLRTPSMFSPYSMPIQHAVYMLHTGSAGVCTVARTPHSDTFFGKTPHSAGPATCVAY
jgi:hypothetical protein